MVPGTVVQKDEEHQSLAALDRQGCRESDPTGTGVRFLWGSWRVVSEPGVHAWRGLGRVTKRRRKGRTVETLEHLDSWEVAFTAGWLAHYRETGTLDWKQYPRVRNSVAPSGPAVDLSVSRLMLVTSAGAYLPGQQDPFDAGNHLGDYSMRLVPIASAVADVDYAHTHYDQTAVRRDPQVLIPLGHLRRMVATGRIGSLADCVVSFMGYQPDAARVARETAPAIVEAARSQQADAVLLVPA